MAIVKPLYQQKFMNCLWMPSNCRIDHIRLHRARTRPTNWRNTS